MISRVLKDRQYLDHVVVNCVAAVPCFHVDEVPEIRSPLQCTERQKIKLVIDKFSEFLV